jgi:hypothetical protein
MPIVMRMETAGSAMTGTTLQRVAFAVLVALVLYTALGGGA